MNNLYIIEEVLSDYTSGMAIIAAPSLERCKELFIEEFVDDSYDETKFVPEFDSAITDGAYKVIEGVDHIEGVVSYVYGGG